MTGAEESIHRKIMSILGGLTGAQPRRLDREMPNGTALKAIESALRDDFDDETAHAIAFHLTDWSADAAFLVALFLCPKQFTDKEIQSGVTEFLFHAPNHIAAAAKLFGNPVQDIFDDERD